MLGHIEEMEVTDCKRAYCAYSNFVRINNEIRQIAACVISMFDKQQQDNLKIDFYDVDPQMYTHLMAIIIEKTKCLKKSTLKMTISETSSSSVDMQIKQLRQLEMKLTIEEMHQNSIQQINNNLSNSFVSFHDNSYSK
jgi:hypothetical protein